MTPSPWRNSRNHIECCHKCVPPKRYPGCGDNCPEYQAEKAKHKIDKERERADKDKRPVLTDYDFNKTQRKYR